MGLQKLSALHIQSANKLWTKDRAKVASLLAVHRQATKARSANGEFNTPDDRILDKVYRTGLSRKGNCDEKGIVYAYFCSLNPACQDSKIYQAYAANWDHAWSVLVPGHINLELLEPYTLKDLGLEAVILDGWTEDWWFPNVPRIDRILQKCWRAENPFAKVIREKIKHMGGFEFK